MYTDENLYQAVNDGVLDKESVEKFRDYIANQADTKSVDEENFRLITGFNDIFVSIAAGILIISSGWIAARFSPVLSFVIVALLSWLLSIFFVQKKRLALPAVLLLLSFVSSSVTAVQMLLASVFELKNIEQSLFIASGFGVLAAWGHWIKFQVPITVAAGVASLIACLLAMVNQVDALRPSLNLFICTGGLLTFALAMMWDAKDTLRRTRKSDVAFWLHLLAAPLIVHPVFAALGIIGGENNLLDIAAVVVLYMALALTSIVIDRRALMVSSLVYVVYALSELFDSYGFDSINLAVSGVMIGSALLLLSVFWHKSRIVLLKLIPVTYVDYLPPVD